MSIRSLMSAAHAAGFALAVTEPSDEESDVAEAVRTGERREPAVSTSRALAVSVPEIDRGAWMRDWFHGVRARVTA